jgi:hypothetical protein
MGSLTYKRFFRVNQLDVSEFFHNVCATDVDNMWKAPKHGLKS